MKLFKSKSLKAPKEPKAPKAKMSGTSRKKVIVLAAMVVLLVATGVLNFFLNAKFPSGGGDDGATTPTFFMSYRSDRETTRTQEILILTNIIESEASSAEAVKEAEAKRLLLAGVMEKELIIEGLIKSKGFGDVIVTMSTENLNIIVKDNDLTLQEAAMILNIATLETSYEAPQIIITQYV